MTLESEQPDMAKLRAEGVSLEDAIQICAAWRDSHPEPQLEPELEPAPFLDLTMYKEPLRPGPILQEHVVNDTDRLLSLSLIHTLTEMLGGTAKIDPTRLVWEGLSPACATELVDFMRRAAP